MASASKPQSPSALIDARIKELPDWRGEVLSKLRGLIKQAVPDVVEEWKWRGVPVWEHDGIICTGETYKDKVKLTFAKGASLADPKRLFNSSLDGNVRRAIDIFEGDKIDATAFKSLVRAAAALNESSRSRPRSAKPKVAAGKPKAPAAGKRTRRPRAAKPVLLSGGNPQIAKGYGDAPVQAYIEAMPDWRRDLGRRIDAIVTRNLPKDARKAVKWNSPFYGVEGQGWLVSFHTFTKYVKVTFFPGTSRWMTRAGSTSVRTSSTRRSSRSG